MFILSNIVFATAIVLEYILWFYMWVVIIRAFISWVNPDPYNPIVRFLYQVTEPILYPIRRRLPFMGGIDLSPLVVILIIVFLQIALVGTLKEFALRVR